MTENWIGATSSCQIRHQMALKFGTLSSQDIADLALYAISQYQVPELLRLSLKNSMDNCPCSFFDVDSLSNMLSLILKQRFAYLVAIEINVPYKSMSSSVFQTSPK